jgi:hypothetical protein
MLLKSRSIMLPLALLALAVGAPATASAEILYGCMNKTNGNVRIVAEGVVCQNSEMPVSWSSEGVPGPAGPTGPEGPAGPTGPAGPEGPAGAGVKTVSGIVNADGTKNAVTPNGYTSLRLSAGRYQIDFPAGTWTAFPVMTVTAFGASGAYGNAIVSSALGFGDGSARFVIDIVSNSTSTYFDNAFMFIAAQSLSST